MTNKKSTKRALLLSALSLLLCVSMLIGSTFAWFTDAVTSSKNQIIAGNLDVELEYKKVVDGQLTAEWETVQGKSEIFDPNALWEPGRVEVVYLKVSNLGTLTLKYQLGVNFKDTVIGKTETGADIKLSEHLIFKTVILENESQVGMYDDRVKAIEAAGTEKGLTDYNGTTTELDAKGGANDMDYVALIVYMPETVGNEANYRGTDAPKIELGINLFATQKDAESDSFGKDYDEEAWVDGMKVYNAADLVSALANEDKVILVNDIETPEVIKLEKNVAINLNGKTLSAALDVSDDVEIKIENGALTNTNKNFSGIQINKGNVTLTNVALTSTRHAVRVEGGEVVINDGIYKVSGSGQTQHAVNVSDGGKATINGGTFIGPKSTSADSGSAVCVQANSTVIINGGDFSGGKNSTLAGAGTLTVYGGTFDQNPAAYVADGYKAVDNGDGTYSVVFPQESLDDLIGSAASDATIEVPAGEYTFPASKLQAGQTLNCAPGTVFKGVSSMSINGATVIGATFDSTGNTNDNTGAGTGTVNGTFKNCTFTGNHGLRYCYAKEGETVVFENCVFDADRRGVHFDAGSGEVIFRECVINGFNAFGSELSKVTFDTCAFDASNHSYDGLNLYCNTELINCTYNFRTGKLNFIDMEGTGKTLTISNCTAKLDGEVVDIASYVGGSKLAQNTVTINGASLVASSEALKAALTNGSNVILAAGEYKMPSSTTTAKVNISGTKDTVLDVTLGAYMDSAENVTITGVTIKTSTGKANGNGSDYAALYAKNVTYVDCTFVGPMRVGRDGAKFVDCTFTQLGNDYVWTYGNDVTFEGCTFNTDGKAILIYSDGGNEISQVAVKNCVFNSTQGAKAGAIANQNCAAIEIHNYGNGVNLVTEGNTYDSNFSGEWRIKTYESGKPKVFVNGTEYTTIAIDGKTMTIDAGNNVTVNK